jgi:acetylornithine deacetylase/succinyl-diaminopimelate desuccinylase-like protein
VIDYNIKDSAKAYNDDMVRFAQQLIQTPSMSGSAKAVADMMLAEMEKLGYDEIFRDKVGNVIGIVRGSEAGPSILYNSHMDHVSPGDEANWAGYAPYGGKIDLCEVDKQDKTGTELAECIHGRAASDVKGGAAVQIYTGGMLAEMKRDGVKFKGNFIFSGVVQEEPAEMTGTLFLLNETFPEKGITYDAMVSSEATSLKLYCGHRGRVELLVTVMGRTAHGSTP